jgi:hypothetical protein
MDLTVWIPQSAAASSPSLFGLARMAPVLRIESERQIVAYVAVFPHLPRSLDAASQLLGEAVNHPSVRVTINGRRVASVTRFWSALLCYRDSLEEQDPLAYCARQAARVGGEAGCPDQTCMAHCQFICTRCLQVVRESGAPPVRAQIHDIAVRAEVEWCPNLRLPNATGEVAGGTL